MRKQSVLVALVALMLIVIMIPTASAASARQSGDLDPSLSANFGSISLSPGFLPDPYTVSMRSGGDMSASAVGCAGYVTDAPDFELFLTDTSSLLRIFFVADGDTTLIINDPYGQWYCNDDYSGVNPMIELASAPGGTYDIWVGSYAAGSYIDGTLYITELGYSPADFTASSTSLSISADGGTATADASGGTVIIGDVNSGGNSENAGGTALSSSGNGGTATANANGGAVVIGDVSSGSSGNAITVGDITGP
jgi:hypothetical protein